MTGHPYLLAETGGGLDAGALAIVAACIVVWTLLSGRLERLFITAPIAFVVMGLVVTHGPTAFIHFNPHSSTSGLWPRSPWPWSSSPTPHESMSTSSVTIWDCPSRLLAVGLPLTIGLVTAVAFGLVPGISLWVAAAIGAIVAPTDAALGASIMEDTRIPNRIRRLLNIESGLNDGIATPFVNLFLAGAVTTEAIPIRQRCWSRPEICSSAPESVSGVGLVGGWALARANASGWIDLPSAR